MRRLNPHRRPSRGVLLLEAVIATTLLLVALTTLLGVMSLLSRQKSQVDRREQAALLAGNLMERLTADPDALIPGETTIPLDQNDVDDAPNPRGLIATLAVTREPFDLESATASDRDWLSVRLHLRWPGPARTFESLRLTTWVAPDSRSQP